MIPALNVHESSITIYEKPVRYISDTSLASTKCMHVQPDGQPSDWFCLFVCACVSVGEKHVVITLKTFDDGGGNDNYYFYCYCNNR